MTYPPFAAPAAPEPRHPVVVVGAGPVGLTVALDLAWRGVPCVLLDDNDTVSTGSRAICWAKRTLEIFDRLGVAAPMLAEGVTWKVGRTYHRDREVFAFDLLPEDGHKHPAFINLAQWRLEEILIDRLRHTPGVGLRFGNRVTALARRPDHVVLEVATPTGRYRLEANGDAYQEVGSSLVYLGNLIQVALANGNQARPGPFSTYDLTGISVLSDGSGYIDVLYGR